VTTKTTTVTRADVHALVEALPDAELAEAKRYLTGLSTQNDPALRAALLAPMDDEPLTEEDVAAIDEARAELAQGQGIPNEVARREFGW
jgi:hypothetical protein